MHKIVCFFSLDNRQFETNNSELSKVCKQSAVCNCIANSKDHTKNMIMNSNGII